MPRLFSTSRQARIYQPSRGPETAARPAPKSKTPYRHRSDHGHSPGPPSPAAAQKKKKWRLLISLSGESGRAIVQSLKYGVRPHRVFRFPVVRSSRLSASRVGCVVCRAGSALRGSLQPLPNEINSKLTVKPVPLAFVPDREYRIGTDESADLLVAYAHVSKIHATFVWSHGVLRVRDAASRNKTSIAVRRDRALSVPHAIASCSFCLLVFCFKISSLVIVSLHFVRPAPRHTG